MSDNDKFYNDIKERFSIMEHHASNSKIMLRDLADIIYQLAVAYNNDDKLAIFKKYPTTNIGIFIATAASDIGYPATKVDAKKSSALKRARTEVDNDSSRFDADVDIGRFENGVTSSPLYTPTKGIKSPMIEKRDSLYHEKLKNIQKHYSKTLYSNKELTKRYNNIGHILYHELSDPPTEEELDGLDKEIKALHDDVSFAEYASIKPMDSSTSSSSAPLSIRDRVRLGNYKDKVATRSLHP